MARLKLDGTNKVSWVSKMSGNDREVFFNGNAIESFFILRNEVVRGAYGRG